MKLISNTLLRVLTPTVGKLYKILFSIRNSDDDDPFRPIDVYEQLNNGCCVVLREELNGN